MLKHLVTKAYGQNEGTTSGTLQLDETELNLFKVIFNDTIFLKFHLEKVTWK
jgi:hypothetical protein